jgi:hypothetical protein
MVTAEISAIAWGTRKNPGPGEVLVPSTAVLVSQKRGIRMPLTSQTENEIGQLLLQLSLASHNAGEAFASLHAAAAMPHQPVGGPCFGHGVAIWADRMAVLAPKQGWIGQKLWLRASWQYAICE